MQLWARFDSSRGVGSGRGSPVIRAFRKSLAERDFSKTSTVQPETAAHRNWPQFARLRALRSLLVGYSRAESFDLPETRDASNIVDVGMQRADADQS